MSPKTVKHLIPNGDGWLLALWQTWDPDKLVPHRRPVAIVPGYGMNSFIFSFHPNGLSLEGALVDAGFEVWRADLRGQGESIRLPEGRKDHGLEEMALGDLPIAVQAMLERTRTGADRVDMIGASLGGTFMFMYAALDPHHHLGSLVAMGSPVRWVEVHPAVRVLFASPWLVGLVPILGTRKMAEWALPRVTRHAPWLISLYMNPTSTDVSAASEMVKTVEDPTRFVNREIARWIRKRDLTVRGVNLSERLRAVDLPLLCIVAAHDGVVPRGTAEFAYHQIGSRDRQLLVVGDRALAMAHADLFVANAAQREVFAPIVEFLQKRVPRGVTKKLA